MSYVSGNSVNIEGSVEVEPCQLNIPRIRHGEIGAFDAGPHARVHGWWEVGLELPRTRSLGTPKPWTTKVTLHAPTSLEVASGPTPHEWRSVWTTLPSILLPLRSLDVAFAPASSIRSYEPPSASPVVEVSARWVSFVDVIVFTFVT